DLWNRLDLDALGAGDEVENRTEGSSWDLGFRRVEVVTGEEDPLGDEEWFDYDMETHKVSPKDIQWEVTSDTGSWTLRILNY
ncbi:hypothetical protein, partial [Streptococcus pneumoniae]|uniref:hypothetical protein n=1 Tax=Streptococcus pneumoniae TaxID=1313 RepID=UPI001E4C34FA